MMVPLPDDIVTARLAALRYSYAGKEADGANEVSGGPKHGGYGDNWYIGTWHRQLDTMIKTAFETSGLMIAMCFV
jgi:hypothetical protein